MSEISVALARYYAEARRAVAADIGGSLLPPQPPRVTTEPCGWCGGDVIVTKEYTHIGRSSNDE